jgi:hypothetical protein
MNHVKVLYVDLGVLNVQAGISINVHTLFIYDTFVQEYFNEG